MLQKGNILSHLHHKAIDLLVPILLFGLAFLLAALFAWRTPRWQAPDEPAHYAYVQHVAETGRPPVLLPECYNEAYKNELVSGNFAEEVDFSRFCYEGHQPPLFYYLMTPIYLASGGALLALRLFCALLGAGVTVVAWQIVRQAPCDRALAAATAGLVALVPQHLAMIGSLNNDALSFLLVALVVWQAVCLLRASEAVQQPKSSQWQLDLKLYVLSALALLTKSLAWVVAPLVGVVFLLRWPRDGARRSLQRIFLMIVVVLLFNGPWFVRNMALYGGTDILGLEQHNAIAVGQPRTAHEIAQRGVMGTISNGLRTTFHSFWGQFGWMKAPLQTEEYMILALCSMMALLGCLFWFARRRHVADQVDGRVLFVFVLWIAISAGLLLYYNFEFVQYQGRYLFPALIPMAFFFMLGLGAWVPKAYRWLPWGGLLLFLLYLDYIAILERLPGMMNY